MNNLQDQQKYSLQKRIQQVDVVICYESNTINQEKIVDHKDVVCLQLLFMQNVMWCKVQILLL